MAQVKWLALCRKTRVAIGKLYGVNAALAGVDAFCPPPRRA